MAKIAYLKYIEPSAKKKVLPFDFPIRNGRVSPIKIKFTILKTEPKTKALPIGFRPIRIKIRPTKIATAMAVEQYFFWVCLTASIICAARVLFVLLCYLKDLAIHGVPPTDNS